MTQANERVGVAIFGAGNVSSGHLDAYMHSSRCEVVAIGSRTKEGAEAKAKEVGIDPASIGIYDDIDALLSDSNVDALSVTTPHSRHASDVVAAAMTELPTSKQDRADQLSATRGTGLVAERIDLRDGTCAALTVQPSTAADLEHGFAAVSKFFVPGKVALAELETALFTRLGSRDVFDDEYLSSGGQLHELIAGHDRFVADLRPLFYRIQHQPPGLCCHPYDCAAWLIAEEAGVILTDGLGRPLDGPMDVTTGLSWAGYANAALRAKIEPLLNQFFRARGV